LSPFDDLVKAQADEHEFDWRLIVAQMYQESRFDPNAKSWAGARGLMQVMPRTARELGVENLKDPEQGIIAGVRYLSWLRDRFESELPVRDRMWFALAAYNAGAGHVRDARRLAKRQGWSSNRWFDNVEKAMLLLSKSKYANNAAHGYVRGSEPVRYVREIRDRYQAYLKLTNNGS
jgi:membrane-bound lytic murein transglycosylase F